MTTSTLGRYAPFGLSLLLAVGSSWVQAGEVSAVSVVPSSSAHAELPEQAGIFKKVQGAVTLRPAGSAQAQARQQQAEPAGAERCRSLKEAPAEGGACDDRARAKLVGQHAAWDLHEGIGPKEGTHQQALHGWAQVELLGDQWHGHRQRRAVDVVDRDEEQHHQEYLPAHLGGSFAGCANALLGRWGGGGHGHEV